MNLSSGSGHNIHVRPFDRATDGPQQERWYKSHDSPVIPPKMLGPEGWAAYDPDTGKVFAYAWTNYQLGSEESPVIISVFSWPVTNPQNTPAQSYRSVCTLVECCSRIAKSEGYGILMAWTANRGLGSIYKRLGFGVAESNATVYHKLLIEDGN